MISNSFREALRRIVKGRDDLTEFLVIIFSELYAFRFVQKFSLLQSKRTAGDLKENSQIVKGSMGIFQF